MKHAIKSKQAIDNHNSIIVVQLFPDNLAERTAIKNVEKMTANPSEKELVENYLHFSLELGNYSIVELLSQTDTSFVIKIHI